MIDSHGKPGIGGNVIGVETELVLDVEVDSDVDVVVGVLMTVVVTTDVLATVWDELVDELMMELVVEEVLLLTTEVEVVTSVEVDVVVEGGGGGGPPPGGSRWRITAKFGNGPDNTLLPTAKPLVPDRRKRDVSRA